MNRTLGMVVLTLVASLGPVSSSSAVTIHVPGDAPTLAAGLALANAGDAVLAAPGTYFEHDLQLKTGVTLASEAGRDLTTIDVQHLGHGAIGADGATLQGFTFVHAGGANLYSVHCVGSSPAILDNRFNHSTSDDILCSGSTSEIARNEFVFDPANHEALIHALSSAIFVHDNVFFANDPNGNLSAMLLESGGGASASRVVDNVIYGRVEMHFLSGTTRTEVARNVVVIQNGFTEALNIAFFVNASIHHNTIIGGGGIFAQGSGNDLLLNHNIIAFGNTGIESFGSGTIQLDCNDVFGEGTPYNGIPPGATDFASDPLFCNRATLDFHLMDGSPCAPLASACGLVGALPVQCGGTPAKRETWGRLKSRYH